MSMGCERPEELIKAAEVKISQSSTPLVSSPDAISLGTESSASESEISADAEQLSRAKRA